MGEPRINFSPLPDGFVQTADIAVLRERVGLRREEAAIYLGVSVRRLLDLVRLDEINPPKVVLGNIELWSREDLDIYLLSHDPMPTEEDVAALRASALGYVYFVGFDSYVKIGFASNVASRLRGLQTAAPAKLKLYLAFPGTYRDENALHVKFAAHRLEGEWFRFSDEIKDWMAERRLTGETSI